MKKLLIKVNGTQYNVEVEEVGGSQKPVATAVRPQIKAAASSAVRTAQPQATGVGSVSAPMPGTILKVNVSLGDTVKKGQVLLILEAMKMENEIVAPIDGKVEVLNVEKGKSVNARDLLVSIA